MLVVVGPMIWGRMAAAMADGFKLAATPDVVTRDGIGTLMADVGKVVAIAVGPIAAIALVAGVIVSVLQVKWKPSAQAIKPRPQKLNPISGAKNIFGKRSL